MGIGFGIGKRNWYKLQGEAAPQDEFIISVKTDNAGTSNNDQFTLQMISGTYDVDWGDSNVDLAQSGAKTHTYSTAGTYDVKVLGGTRMYHGSSGALDSDKIVDLKNWGIGQWVYISNGFQGCVNMVITATDVPDYSAILNPYFSLAFSDCPLQNYNFNNVSVTSSVTNLNRAFLNNSAFNQPLDNWDVSGVLDMDNTFNGCSSFDQDLSGWQISQVTDFTNFMAGVTLSTANYDALLIAWDAQGAMSYSGTVNFGSSKYTSGGAAETARTSLISKWGGITDGGAA